MMDALLYVCFMIAAEHDRQVEMESQQRSLCQTVSRGTQSEDVPDAMISELQRLMKERQQLFSDNQDLKQYCDRLCLEMKQVVNFAAEMQKNDAEKKCPFLRELFGQDCYGLVRSPDRKLDLHRPPPIQTTVLDDFSGEKNQSTDQSQGPFSEKKS